MDAPMVHLSQNSSLSIITIIGPAHSWIALSPTNREERTLGIRGIALATT